jgi:hypothetical protein
MGKIVMIDRGDCTFVEKARMIQRAGGIGMIAVNSKDTAIPLLGVEGDDDIEIWSMSISKSTGDKLKKAIASTDYSSDGREGKDQFVDNGKVMMYIEEGGQVEKLLESLRGHVKLPELYLNGKRIGDEKDVSRLYSQRKLVPMLEKAGAFELPAGHQKCKQERAKHLRQAMAQQSRSGYNQAGKDDDWQ